MVADNLRDIRYFVAVYEEHSFTAAAERENATQSGVSQHIRKLEERAGLRLFLRGSSLVQPTPAGDRYYAYCVDLLRTNDAANQAMRSFGRGLDGEIAIGLMPTMTRCVLAPALVQFQAMHPNVVVHVVEAYSAALTQHARAGEVTFAVVPATPDTTGLSTKPFARTSELLVSAASRPGHGQPVRLASLGPLRVVTPGAQNARRQMLQTYFVANDVKIAAVLELDTMFATLDLVARTDWVAVLPGVMMAEDRAGGRFSISPLTAPPLQLDLVAVQSSWRSLTPAAMAFLEVLQAETARASAVWEACGG
jgi:DNA-binding transcriptional LysR family regulator